MSERTKCPACLGYGTDGMETTYVPLLGMYQTTHVPCPRCEGRGTVDVAKEPQCAIKGCEAQPVTRCACCNREVCADDLVGAKFDGGPGICFDCVFRCLRGSGCKVVQS